MDNRKNRNQIHNAINTTLSGLRDDPWLGQRVIIEVNRTRMSNKKIKDRFLHTFVLLIILMFATATALAIGVLSGLFRLEQSDVGAMRNCISTGDTLYLLSSSGLCTWMPDNQIPEILISIDELGEKDISFESLLYLDDDSLVLMDVKHRKLWRYQDGEFVVLLDYTGTEMDIPNVRWTKVVCQEQNLFLLAQSTDDTKKGKRLYCANPQTGEVDPIHIPEGYILDLCTYEPGKVLVLVGYVQQRSERLLVLDTTTRTVSKTLYTAPIQLTQGLAYGETGLYALVGGVLSRWESTEWVELNAAAHSFLAQSFAVMNEGYVSVSYNEMQYLPFVSEKNKSSLSIRGVMAIDNSDEDFQQLNQIAVIRARDPSMTPQDVRKAIESGDDTDLFHIALDADILSLIADGLVAPLGASDALVADVQGMTFALRESLMNDKELYAVPSVMIPKTWQGTREIPTTYTELLAQVGREVVVGWDEKSIWTKKEYASAMLEAFISESTRNGEIVNFNEDAFSDSLRALKESKISSEIDGDLLTTINPAAVISLGGNPPETRDARELDEENKVTESPCWLIPPTVIPNVDPNVPVRVYVYLLNPHAQNVDAAIAYLEYIVSHRDPGKEGLMKPEHAEVILRPLAQHDLEDANAEKQAEILCMPDSWAITQERLDVYRDILLPNLDMQLHPLLSVSARREGGLFNLLHEIVVSYLDGHKSLEECLANLQEVVIESF